MADFGDIVTRLTVDKRQFESGLTSVSRDLSRVRSEISKVSAQAATGNQKAFLQLVSLVAQEEQLAQTAKRAAEIETRARQAVIGVRKEELHILAQQEVAERKVAQAAQRTAIVRSGAMRGGAARGGMSARAGLGMAGQGLGYGASDAATAYQFGGSRAAVLSAANNLPMIGIGLAAMAPALARIGGQFGMVASRVVSVLGPLGILASVVLPLFATQIGKLIDKMLEGTRVAQGVEAALSSAKTAREARQQLADVRTNPESLPEVQKRLGEARDELADAETARRQTTRAFVRTDATNAWTSDTERNDVNLQIAELTRRITDLRAKVANEERLLREGESAAFNRAARQRNSPQFNDRGFNVAAVRRAEHARKMEEYRNRFNDREEVRASALKSYDEFAMRRGISAGISSRITALRQQRQAIIGGGTNFMAAEATTRGNSVDRIVEIANAKREAKQEAWQKTQINKLDKQIELLEKMYAELRGGDGPTLLPAGLG